MGKKMGELMNSKALRNWRPARIVILFRTRLRRIAGLGKNYESEAKNLKLQVRKLLGKYGKRVLAVFYLVLEAASFLPDIFEKSLLWPQLLFINCGIPWYDRECNCNYQAAPGEFTFINQILLLRTWKQTAACLWPLVQIINCRISRFITQIRLLRTQKQTAAHLWPQLLVFTCGRFICQLLATRRQKQMAACLCWLKTSDD